MTIIVPNAMVKLIMIMIIITLMIVLIALVPSIKMIVVLRRSVS